MDVPPYLNPFVLDPAPIQPRRQDFIDVYAGDSRAPAVVFIHGGPLPPGLQRTPRDWPIFTGYGSLAAGSGLVGVTVDLPLHTVADFPAAADVLADAVERTRALDEVDPDRVALWFFSGGSLLAARWLAAPPAWLRGIALTYPMIAPAAGVEAPAFDGVAALSGAGALPILLTRVGNEYPQLVPAQEAFVAAADGLGTKLEIIEVPDGQHGFDNQEPTPEARAAVSGAMAWVSDQLAAG